MYNSITRVTEEGNTYQKVYNYKIDRQARQIGKQCKHIHVLRFWPDCTGQNACWGITPKPPRSPPSVTATRPADAKKIFKRKAAELVIALQLSFFIYRIYSLHRTRFLHIPADPGQSWFSFADCLHDCWSPFGNSRCSPHAIPDPGAFHRWTPALDSIWAKKKYQIPWPSAGLPALGQ